MRLRLTSGFVVGYFLMGTHKGHHIPSGVKFGTSLLSRTEKGTHLLQGTRIFKAGTFKDSMGIQRTWEVEHLEQMIFHFNMLKERGTFPNVPVRADHSSSINSVVGYIDNLYRDGLFLAADIEFTEPDAKERYERGTYRARSLEVGMYETNDEAQFWPTVMGLAFVDIPAVEGLYSKSNDGHSKYAQVLVDEDKENDMATGPTDPNPAPQPDPNQPQPPQPPTDPNNPQPAPTEPQPQPQPQPQPPQANMNVSTGTSTTGSGFQFNVPPSLTITTTGSPSNGNSSFKFKMNGQETVDYSAVQKHIEMLEGFAKETRDTGRTNFVKSLATANRITAAQIEQFTQLVLGLTDEQFEAFTKAYDGAPPMSLFGPHADGGTDRTPGVTDPVQDEIDILEERVKMHKRGGMSEKDIQQTESYKKLESLKARGTAA